MNELALVDRIRRMAARSQTRGGVVLSIGDDCAIFRPRASPRNGEDLLFTADQMIEDVHFRTSQKPANIGERALARSLSDIAAMGGEPRFCLVTLSTPQNHERWIEEFYRGLLKLAKRTAMVLAGGDLAHSDKIHCDVMVCGAVARGKAIRRDGARLGDAIYVSGRLGKSWTEKIEPRLALGQSLAGRATACLDLSDGLSLDLHRLCVASHVAAEIESVPVARNATIDRALHGGEDYELLFTLPPKLKPPERTTRVGTIVRGKAGFVLFRGKPLEPRGYDHFQ